MKRLVIDIETVGTPFEEHDQYVREYLLRGLSEAEAEEEKRRGGLSPFRGHIVAIGVINADDGRSCVLYDVPGQLELVTRREGSRTYISGNEKAILQRFWDFLGKDDRFISFNGRQFDGPFLMIRSAVHGVVPKRDLVGYRYAFHPNCDLREVLSFWGTLSRQAKFNLDFACKVFGITSSKTDSKDGRAVEMMYRAGRYDEIAEYCLDDVRATCELYQKLVPTLLMWNNDFRISEERHPPVVQTSDLQTAFPVETAVAPPMLQSERSFLEGITDGSKALSDSLDDTAGGAVITSRSSLSILEKLIRSDEPEGNS